jgi:hypothetical protein
MRMRQNLDPQMTMRSPGRVLSRSRASAESRSFLGSAAAGTHFSAMQPRQFGELRTLPGVGSSQFGVMGHEGSGREEFDGERPGFGAMGHAETGHMGAGGHPGSGRG